MELSHQHPDNSNHPFLFIGWVISLILQAFPISETLRICAAGFSIFCTCLLIFINIPKAEEAWKQYYSKKFKNKK